MAERRKSERSRTLLGARATSDRLLLPVDCHVTNISDGGAKVVVDGAGYMADSFQLDIPHRSVMQEAQVRWREPNAVGVEFVAEPVAAASSEHVRKLEAENALLRRRIADMAKRLDSYGDSEASAY